MFTGTVRASGPDASQKSTSEADDTGVVRMVFGVPWPLGGGAQRSGSTLPVLALDRQASMVTGYCLTTGGPVELRNRPGPPASVVDCVRHGPELLRLSEWKSHMIRITAECTE